MLFQLNLVVIPITYIDSIFASIYLHIEHVWACGIHHFCPRIGLKENLQNTAMFGWKFAVVCREFAMLNQSIDHGETNNGP